MSRSLCSSASLRAALTGAALGLLLQLSPLVIAPVQAADLPTLPGAVVSLPWQDFRQLVQAGLAPAQPEDPAPQDFAIGRAAVTGRLEGESAVFAAKLRIDVLKAKGWVEVPLLPASYGLRSAKSGGQDAVVTVRNGWFVLFTNKRGPVDLELEFAAPAFEKAGQNSVSVQLPRAGAATLDFVVPGSAPLELSAPGATQLREVARGNERQISLLVPPSGNLSLSWRAKVQGEEAIAQDPRVYAEQQTLIGVAEGLLTGTTTVNYSILHKGINQLRLSLPADVTVLEVNGQGLRGWTVDEKGGARVLTADLNFAALGSYGLKVQFERPLPLGSTAVELPLPGVLGVERAKGWVGVDARSNLELAAGAAKEAQPVDVRELPAAITGQTDFPVLLGFRTRGAAPSIPLDIRQYPEVDMLVTIIDQLAATTVLTPDGRRMTQVVYAMRNNRAQYLRVKLPEGATPWSTFVGGRAVKPARAEDGRVLVPLARSQAAGGELARFAVEIVYVEDGDPPAGGKRGRFDAALPIADVPATAVAWSVFVPAEAKVKERKIVGSLRRVEAFTAVDAGGVTVREANAMVQQQAAATFAAEAQGKGVQPVRVSLPLDGKPIYFEKLLVLDEALTVGFDWTLKN